MTQEQEALAVAINKLVSEELQPKLEKWKTAEVYKTLDLEKQNEFARFCNFVYKSPFWPMISKELTDDMIQFAGMKAEDYLTVVFGRASANGVGVVDTYFEKMANKFESLAQDTKETMNKEEEHRSFSKI